MLSISVSLQPPIHLSLLFISLIILFLLAFSSLFHTRVFILFIVQLFFVFFPRNFLFFFFLPCGHPPLLRVVISIVRATSKNMTRAKIRAQETDRPLSPSLSLSLLCKILRFQNNTFLFILFRFIFLRNIYH